MNRDQLYSTILISILYAGILFLWGCDTENSVNPNQHQVYIKLFGGYGSEEGNDLVQLPDKGFVLAGSTTSDTNGDTDIFVVRTDSTGNEIWKRHFGGPGDDTGNSVVVTNDGRIIVCGAYSQSKPIDTDHRDVYVITLDQSGNLIRETFYGDSLRDEVGKKIVDLSNGGFFITSTDYTNINTPKIFLIQTDGQLNPIENGQNYVGITDTANIGMVTIEDNLPYFTSFGSSKGSYDPDVQKGYNFFIFQYRSQDIQTINPRYFGGVMNEIGTDMARTKDNGFILCGYIQSGSRNRAYVVKTNSSFDVQWEKELSGNLNEWGSGIQQTYDGGYIVLTTVQGVDLIGEEIGLIKLDENGNVSWSQSFGSQDDDKGAKVLQLQDEGYAIVGTVSLEIGSSASKLCLIRVNKSGELIPLN